MATAASEIDPEVKQMFEKFYAKYPVEYRDETWYLTLAASLTALGAPSLTGPLFHHVLQLPNAPSPLTLSTRLRAALFKIYTLTGIAPVLGAFFPLASAESAYPSLPSASHNAATPLSGNPSTLPPDAPAALLTDPHTYRRGSAFLAQLYAGDLPGIVAGMGRHGPDIMHVERMVIYGLHLADFSVLGPRQTELVVFPALLCGGTRGAGEWHVRGARRTGVEWGVVERVADAVGEVAEWVLGPERERERERETGEEGGWKGRQEIVVGRGRGQWVQWVREVRAGMHGEGEE